jgi:hypothetical protein
MYFDDERYRFGSYMYAALFGNKEMRSLAYIAGIDDFVITKATESLKQTSSHTLAVWFFENYFLLIKQDFMLFYYTLCKAIDK